MQKTFEVLKDLKSSGSNTQGELSITFETTGSAALEYLFVQVCRPRALGDVCVHWHAQFEKELIAEKALTAKLQATDSSSGDNASAPALTLTPTTPQVALAFETLRVRDWPCVRACDAY
jgi:hypothetical protein